MCSIPDSLLDQLARAIDELAEDCRHGVEPAQLAERIAQVWEMVGDLDPELARRRPGYEGPPERLGPMGARTAEGTDRARTRHDGTQLPPAGRSRGQ